MSGPKKQKAARFFTCGLGCAEIFFKKSFFGLLFGLDYVFGKTHAFPLAKVYTNT
ncbi:hypothetical protein H4684_002075 [Desulfomicrobium macestii]|jgi:hypothetical protein|uniref:Uncharacterized protein n=1 Tax=Desulfomicrobium macestii TaxID=90731 RepID=A0ABR9H3Y6_9BACT|nr:hypothetical protein [Desulfomicrobium macestii]